MTEVTASRTLERSALERLLRRDRAVTVIALVVTSALAWVYIAAGVGMDSEAMSMPDMVMPAEWTLSYVAIMFAMWAIMMVAMMLPSAAPMILLFATIQRRRGISPFEATARFAAAYVIVWTAVSTFAVLLQWQLDRLAMLTPVIATANRALAAIVLITAGIYQFTPLKQACLRYCRSPLDFISTYWNRGPFYMGLMHGLYCVGCCWMLMLLLFVGGVMNLLWVAALAAFILIEKIAPPGRWVSYTAGLLMCIAGTSLLVRSFM